MNAVPMKALYARCLVLLPFLSFSLALSAFSQAATPLLVYEFDKTTMLENGWTEATSGFSGQAPGSAAPIAFPPGTFKSSQDQRGLAITVKPGEVAFLQTFFPLQTEGSPLLLRMTVRANAPGASIALAALRGNLNDGNGVDGSIATHIPASAASFVGQERRIVLVYEPDSGDLITPLIQVAAAGQTGSVVVFVDKLEVLKLDAGEFGAAVSSSPNPTPTPSPLPAATPTPTLTPTITPTPTPELPQTITIPLPNLPPDAVPLEMVLIPAGTFMMGSPESDPDRVDDEIPQHQVTISQPFYMGKYEVTQEQWVAVMGINPSTFKYGNHPMDSVSWKNCDAFIQNLNILGLGTFRLPTEAEWEYACRAGTTTRYFWGDDPNNNEFNGYAWCLTNSQSITHRVGLKLPNPWGLYDIAGNVFEWCQDSYGPYPSNAVVDPSGPQTATNRVGRGGCWGLEPTDCRSANREPGNPEGYYSYVGLRLVLGS